jgi:phage FluMu protein Com
MGNTFEFESNVENIQCSKCNKTFIANKFNRGQHFYKYCKQCTIFITMNKKTDVNTQTNIIKVDSNKMVSANDLPTDLS